jgi:hypothetical protein
MMPLSCSCEEPDEAEFYWTESSDYSAMPVLNRRKRCTAAGCGKLINAGETVLMFERSRYPVSDIEERIYGDGYDAVPLAERYLCETCADLYLSLRELRFCVSPDENIRELVREYAAMQEEARA